MHFFGLVTVWYEKRDNVFIRRGMRGEEEKINK